ncbi:hypothetical protein FGO68_gene2157 [Halteria grandinella]|uniref:Uncharacterized protein n=1 Tax=Halteria grandinella TaxID=5974 RepID=A0A8J8T3V4_HALGN|nr:hypothetical protein FGO68_gene2157 [Halteria grandinella]
MWRIERKYLFIELMSYLEFKHTQIILYQSQKEFRSRLIRSFKHFKNTSKEIGKYPSYFLNLYFKQMEPESIFIAEQVWNEIQFHQTIDFSLNIRLLVYDSIEMPNVQLKQLEQKQQFRDVSVIIDENFDSIPQAHFNWLLLVQNYFSHSKSISFIADLRKSNLVPKFTKSIPFIESQLNNIKSLKINANQHIQFNDKCLQKLKEMKIYYYQNDTFNLQFEELSIPYSNTTFVLKIKNPTVGMIEDAYSQYPNMFEKLNCQIHLTFSSEWEKEVLEEYTNKFPKNNLQLSLQSSGSNDQILSYLEKLDNQNFPLISNIQRQFVFEIYQM